MLPDPLQRDLWTSWKTFTSSKTKTPSWSFRQSADLTCNWSKLRGKCCSRRLVQQEPCIASSPVFAPWGVTVRLNLESSLLLTDWTNWYSHCEVFSFEPLSLRSSTGPVWGSLCWVTVNIIIKKKKLDEIFRALHGQSHVSYCYSRFLFYCEAVCDFYLNNCIKAVK